MPPDILLITIEHPRARWMGYYGSAVGVVTRRVSM
jgi:hypothetical protein